MITKDMNGMVANFKKLKKSFKLRETHNFSMLITSSGSKMYYNKDNQFAKGLFLFNMVKKDVTNYIVDNGKVIPYKDLPVNYSNPKYDTSKKIIGVDIDNAYWSVAYLKGYISENTYHRGLEYKKEFKPIRLSALSSLGKARVYKVYEYGEYKYDEITNINEDLQNVYLDIRYSTYGIMENISKLLKNDFCCWKTDCIFFYDTKENIKLVKKEIRDYGLKCKIE